MGIWQRLRGVESRQAGGSYTDALVQLIQSREGGSSALPGATSALECASGFVSRAFASADVTTGNSILAAALDPLTLSTIGQGDDQIGRISGRYPNGSGRRRTSPCSGFFVGRSRRIARPGIVGLPSARFQVQGGNPRSRIFRLLESFISGLRWTPKRPGVESALYKRQVFQGVYPLKSHLL